MTNLRDTTEQLEVEVTYENICDLDLDEALEMQTEQPLERRRLASIKDSLARCDASR